MTPFFTLPCYSATNRLPFVKHFFAQNAATHLCITVKDQGTYAITVPPGGQGNLSDLAETCARKSTASSL